MYSMFNTGVMKMVSSFAYFTLIVFTHSTNLSICSVCSRMYDLPYFTMVDDLVSQRTRIDSKISKEHSEVGSCSVA